MELGTSVVRSIPVAPLTACYKTALDVTMEGTGKEALKFRGPVTIVGIDIELAPRDPTTLAQLPALRDLYVEVDVNNTFITEGTRALTGNKKQDQQVPAFAITTSARLWDLELEGGSPELSFRFAWKYSDLSKVAAAYTDVLIDVVVYYHPWRRRAD